MEKISGLRGMDLQHLPRASADIGEVRAENAGKSTRHAQAILSHPQPPNRARQEAGDRRPAAGASAPSRSRLGKVGQGGAVAGKSQREGRGQGVRGQSFRVTEVESHEDDWES
jgi:hypothetical protein